MTEPNELEEIRKQLDELEALQNVELTYLAPMDAASKALDEEIERIRYEAQQAIVRKREEQAAIKLAKRESEKKKNELALQIERAQQRLRVAEAAERERAELLTLEDRWNALTIGAPWREWAKDHQIHAAHKITYNKRMILADTMGTGKTLSAVSALDMIQAATKDAEPTIEDKYGYYWYLKDEPFPVGGNYRIPPDGVDKSKHEDGFAHHGNYQTVVYPKPAGNRVLWFTPAPVAAGAEREIKRWAKHRNVIVLTGKTRNERRTLLEILIKTKDVTPNILVIINYEFARKDKQSVELMSTPGLFDTIILDEAHSVKNIKSGAYQTVKSIIDNSQAEYVIPMTGTPILNRPQELFALLSFVDPKNFYSVNMFLDNYCTQAWIGNSLKWVFRTGGADALLKKMGHLYLRRTKRECGFMLEEPQEIVYDLEFINGDYAEQQRVYKSMRDQARIMLDKKDDKKDDGEERGIFATNVLSLYTRLRQLITAPTGVKITDRDGNVIEQVTVTESIKLDACLNLGGEDEEPSGIIPEALSDSKVVVFSQFNEPLELLVERCKAAGINAAVYNGDASLSERNKMVEAFRDIPVGEVGSIDVLCMNHKTGGVGVDGLQYTSNHVIIIDREWNPGKEDQSIGRLDRMGQEKQVIIHRLRVKGTIDAWMDELIDSKRDMIDGFNDRAKDLAGMLADAIDSGLI